MKRRAPNVRSGDVAAILSIIDGWEAPPLTWNALLDRVSRVLHVTYVRQTLHRHSEVACAFRRRRLELAEAPKRKSRSADLQAAQQRLERLAAENARLLARNDALLERFVTWSYNASLFGMDEDKLDQPIPPAARN